MSEVWSILLEADTPFLRPFSELVRAEAPGRVDVYRLEPAAQGPAPSSLDPLEERLDYLLTACGTPVEFVTLPSTALGPRLAGTRVIPLPADCKLVEDGLDVVLSSKMADLLEVIDPDLLDEALLERICRLPGTAPWDGWLAEACRLATDWLALPAQDLALAWAGLDGARYRHLQSLRLWSKGLMDAHRSLIETAIRRWQASEQDDWAALLVMLLYKRKPLDFTADQAPDWLQPELTKLLPQLGRCLGILAPIRDFRVTVLIPTYNRVELLRQAVEAVRAQHYQDWTLIVADDCSSDETEAYLSAVAAEDARVIQVRQARNLGFNATMQALLAQAETELVVCFTDDQLMYPHHLEACIAFWRQHPWLACVGGGLHIEHADGQVLQHGPFYPQAQVAETQPELERCGMICPLGPSAVYRKVLLRELAPYDSWFCAQGQLYSPWDYLCNVKLLSSYEVGYLPQPLMMMLHADAGMSGKHSTLPADLLNLLRYLLEDYQALFANPYPLRIAEAFAKLRFEALQLHFSVLFSQCQDLEQFRSGLLAQGLVWEAWLSCKQTIQRCVGHVEPMIDQHNPFRGQGLSPAVQAPPPSIGKLRRPSPKKSDPQLNPEPVPLPAKTSQTPPDPEALIAQLAQVRETATAWLALDPEAAAQAWQGELGTQSRQIFELGLWRHGVMARDQDLRERAESGLDDPALVWQARLALLLYKRWDRQTELDHAPDWFLACWRDLQPGLGQCLELLPPVQDFTVTITIPTYNRVKLLRRAVNSILAQSCQDWRLIICDDGSSDGTEAYARALCVSDSRIRYLRKPQNSGLLDTYLQLLAAVETELIICFADDDVLYPHLLARTIGFFHAHPRLACVGGGFHTKVQVGPFYPQDCVVDNQRELVRCCFVSPLVPLGTVQRKAVLAEVAAYDPWTRSVQGAYAISDYLSSVKILGRFEVGLVSEILGYHDISSISSQFHRDDTALYTCLIRELVGDYERLYGEGSMPGDALLYFLHQRTFATYLYHHFRLSLHAESDPLRWRAYVTEKQPGWEAFYQTRRELLTGADPQAGPLNLATALGPTWGEFTPEQLSWYQQAQQIPKET